MIKRIIFDIDGTLITGVNFKPFVTQTFKRYGIEDLEKSQLFIKNISKYEQNYNYYDRDLYLFFFSNVLGVKLSYSFLKILFDELKKAIPKDSTAIKKMLSDLKDMNYELVLLSNYFEESQRNRLTAMGINDYFIEYYGERIIKPNELAYLSAKGRLNPSECLIVGDDKILDIDVPKTLGFKTIYVGEKGDIKSVSELSPEIIKKYDNN